VRPKKDVSREAGKSLEVPYLVKWLETTRLKRARGKKTTFRPLARKFNHVVQDLKKKYK